MTARYPRSARLSIPRGDLPLSGLRFRPRSPPAPPVSGAL